MPLDEAAKWWNLGVLLNGSERYEKAVKHLRKAVEVYGIGAALKSVDNTFTRLLIENGADIETKDRDRRTPLHLAASNGHEVVARVLAELGADMEARDGFGQTPLHLAAAKGREAVARLLR